MTNLEIVVNKAYEMGLITEEQAYEIFDMPANERPFKTVSVWRKEGKMPKKGTHAVFKALLWRSPANAKAGAEELPENEDIVKNKTAKYWASFFTAEQVESVEQKKAKKTAKAEKKTAKAEKPVLTLAGAKERKTEKTEKKTAKAKKTAPAPAQETKKAKKTEKKTAKKILTKATAKKTAKAEKVLKKTAPAKMTENIKESADIIRFELKNGKGEKGFMEMSKAFYTGLSASARKQMNKALGIVSAK